MWWLVKFDNGQLEASAAMQGCSRKYAEIEKKLIQYLDIRAQKYAQYKCGVTWIFIGNKLLKFGEVFGIKDFKASPICVSYTFKHNKKVVINLNSEKNDTIDEKRDIIFQHSARIFILTLRKWIHLHN